MFKNAGEEAAAIVKLWWVLFGVGLFVTLIVVGILIAGCLRNYQERTPPVAEQNLRHALVIGVSTTVILLLGMLVATHIYSQPFAGDWEESPTISVAKHSRDASASDAAEPEYQSLTIEVTGKRWWWSVAYLNESGDRLFETANEIHIPVGVPVRLRLRSDNVIHSFWVPSLGGKEDLVPGRTNYLWLEAGQPGVYRGQCAEFCGLQHAKMAFDVVAETLEDFTDWVAVQEASAREPQTDIARRGRAVFRGSACANCHTIRGVSSVAHVSSQSLRAVGPDLTHLASRRSLAAGTLPNRRGHLGGWIADPQSIKPGNLMPSVPLAAEDFHALMHYLETLE
ncbi:cytochrome c oxidase subunit II [Thalassoroseus pseudoceratinae]|uniref:cytochrome c oxidase subunit II n=1 Tax=Thalassoroseus pseudoceratinae TaxID=2713176 RepID=UPI00141F1A0D|nr:cytochrome c oxidase subunit II [Thalassoroseus pseudoceratinae]